MVWVKRVMGVVLICMAVWLTKPLWSRSEPLDPQRIAAQLAAAKAAGQPVLLDFYADWCPPCKEMERVTFPDPRVQERLAKLVFIKVDLTRKGSPDVEALMREYAIRAVPTYVFLDATGRELTEHRQGGFIAPEGFAALLDKVLAAAGTR